MARGLILFILLLIACSSGEKNREQSQLYLKIGTNHLVKGNATLALQTLLEAEKLNTADPVVHNNLGLVYFLKKDFEKAESHITQALRINPKYSDARNNLGRVYIELTRYDEAIKELTVVTQDLTYGTIEKAYINLGLAYMKKGNIDTALVQFKKGIDANNKFCPSHNYHGQALFNLQKFDEAAESFETALKLCNNNYDEPHYYSGLSYYKTGQTEKAIARMEEVIRLYPDTEFATKAKSMLKIMR